MENTATQENIQDFVKETDKENLNYRITDIGNSIFKQAENANEIIFLMGINMIQKIEKTNNYYKWYSEVWKTRRTLKSLNTILLIPVIAALIETVNKQSKNK